MEGQEDTNILDANKDRIEAEEYGQDIDIDIDNDMMGDDMMDDDLDDLQVDEMENGMSTAMMNELLLVCSNLGLVTMEDNESKFLRGEDCIEWIHDLQRAIRRDDHRNKWVALKLGQWNILSKKLLPLLMNHQDDW